MFLGSRKFFLTAFVVLLLLLLTQQLYAGDKGTHSAAQQINVLLNNIKSINADFKQTVSDAQGNLLQQSNGMMKIKRPLRFIWNTNKPYEQMISSDGKTLWVYDQDLQQVTIQVLNKQVGNTPALLFSGDPNVLAKNFDIRHGSNTNASKSFDLYPLDPQAAFTVMSVSFKNDILAVMELKDHLGQRTQISFTNVKLNPRLPNKAFVFNPPEGVDIIHNTPAN